MDESLVRQNHILSSLSRADFASVEPHLEAILLERRDVLEPSGKPIKHVYFLKAGIASVVATTARDRQIEVGIIGREGMTGIPVVMGTDSSPHSTYMQVAGYGERIAADALRTLMRERASLKECFLRFAQAFMLQTAHTALANGQAKLEERLARWLLMAHDRLDGDEIPLTHEFLALMLSVRRAGVTVALQLLESQGLISATRGLIVVVDRAGLKQVANGLYGIPEAEYARLTGWRAKP